MPKEYNDHDLKGKYKRNKERECHICGQNSDFLLRYKKDNKTMIIHLLATGDHRMVLNTESAVIFGYYFGYDETTNKIRDKHKI